MAKREGYLDGSEGELTRADYPELHGAIDKACGTGEEKLMAEQEQCPKCKAGMAPQELGYVHTVGGVKCIVNQRDALQAENEGLAAELEHAQAAAAETATFVTPFVEGHQALLALSNVYWHPPSSKHSHSPTVYHDKPETIDAIWRKASAALETATTPGSQLCADIFHKAYGICMSKKAAAAKEKHDG